MTSIINSLCKIPYFHGKGWLILRMVALNGQPLVVENSRGARLLLGNDLGGHLILPYLIGKYEHEVYATIMQIASRLTNASFVDIGANVGFYMVSVAKQFESTKAGAVHAFEPNPVVFQLLQKNAELNPSATLYVQPSAVADKSGTLTLYFSSAAATCGSLQQVEPYLTEQVAVPVITLDEYMASYPDHRVGLMKIDIEGAELLALRGAVGTIQKDRPIIIYEECGKFCRAFGYTVHDVRKLLKAYNYTFFEIKPTQLGGVTVVEKAFAEVGADAELKNILAIPRESGLPSQFFSPV